MIFETHELYFCNMGRHLLANQEFIDWKHLKIFQGLAHHLYYR